MNENTWGLQFVKIDVKGDKFDTLLALNTGDEERTRGLFNQIKCEFIENNGEPDCIIDLLDEEDSIVDDFSVTSDQVAEISFRLGHEIN